MTVAYGRWTSTSPDPRSGLFFANRDRIFHDLKSYSATKNLWNQPPAELYNYFCVSVKRRQQVLPRYLHDVGS